ncbi:MAG: UvrD-helicase domain-containing protein [Chloroherpetonaceae bacterium]|nr:UvrD-helicase domain-containing protein [Chloroherpetonaceae bacterium]
MEQVSPHFTADQERAVRINADLCVVAGAGSGKTRVLVERFLRLITESSAGTLPPEMRAGVDDILVITFTDRATREMKSRIAAALEARGMTAERRQIENAYISTIHGFGLRLLQENPFEAGVDPQFRVMDEAQARRLMRQAFDQVVARAFTENDPEITELVTQIQSQSDLEGDRLSVLARNTEEILAALRGAGVRLSEVEEHVLRGPDATAIRALDPVRAALHPVLSEIGACYRVLKRARHTLTGALQTAFQAIEDRKAHLRRDACVQDTLRALPAILQAASRVRPRRGAAPGEEQALPYFYRIREACQKVQALLEVPPDVESETAAHTHAMWQLILQVWQTYTEEKRRLCRLDSDDLQAEPVYLLEAYPEVRDRYRRKFRHLLVDEFQDTNPLQMRLIELLHAPGCNWLFVVGDAQQSIYGFRHARVTLFQQMERQFREGDRGVHVALQVNFRSRPELLRVVETIFQQAWRDASPPFLPMQCGAAFAGKPVPSVEILITQDMSRRDYVPLEAAALAARIRRMVEQQELFLTHRSDPRCGQPVRYRDIAVLLRALTDIQEYERAFTRQGVPYFVVGGGRGYYARQEIRDVVNLLTVIDTPLNDVALVAALRSPFAGVSVDTLIRLTRTAERGGQRQPLYLALPALLEDDTLPEDERERLNWFLQAVEELRAEEDRLLVGLLLERLIARFQYDVRLLIRPNGRRRLANVRKLVQMAHHDPVIGVSEFIRRVRDLEKLADREGDAPVEEEASDVVRLITIHSAKGLEFPVVFLADLSRGLSHRWRDPFVCDPHRMAIGARLHGRENLAYRAIDRERQLAEAEEHTRVLYVAMTRAREHLVLSGNLSVNRRSTSCWSDQIFPLLGVQQVPESPERRTLIGGVEAVVAPLRAFLPEPEGSPERGTRTAES